MTLFQQSLRQRGAHEAEANDADRFLARAWSHGLKLTIRPRYRPFQNGPS